MKGLILGISAFYHDSAACLIGNGEILCAVQEERFTRIKNDSNFPLNSIQWILESQHIGWENIDAIVYYEKPFLSFERIVENFLQYAPRGFANFSQALPLWIKRKLFLERTIRAELKAQFQKKSFPPIFYSEHHLSHAASAFFPSPYHEALVVAIDGVGEWATTSVFHGIGNQLKPLLEIDFPHSLGLLYCALTSYLGFKVNSGEYKVMGLAPYGEPKYYELMRQHLITLHQDGSYSLNLRYFGHTYHQRSYSPQLEALLGRKARNEESPLEQFHMDIASSLQKLLEEILIHLLNCLANKYPQRKLCLAGGVALNCVANSKFLQATPFKNIWVQPAAGDAGGAVGAALSFYHLHQQKARTLFLPDGQKNSTLGPEFSNQQIEEFLSSHQLPIKYYSNDDLAKKVAMRLAQGEIAGWFQGAMEFGPRALGHRSILGDSRIKEMQSRMNLKIKFRESFRPFAPIVLSSDARDIFEWDRPAPYMQFVASVAPKYRLPENSQPSDQLIDRINQVRSSFPAITHLDYSARLQTVDDLDPRPIGELLRQFKNITGVGMLINTSFNIRGEPIVCTPEDAYRCFYHTAIDFLVLGNYVIDREDIVHDSRPPKKQQVNLD